MFAELLNPANYRITLFALPTLLTASAMLALGLMVLVRDRHSRVSVSFFVMTLTGAIWLFSYSAGIPDAGAARSAWSVIDISALSSFPRRFITFPVTSLQLYHPHPTPGLADIREISAFFLVIVFAGDAFFVGVQLYWWGYYPIYDWIGVVFVCYFFVLMALSLRE